MLPEQLTKGYKSYLNERLTKELTQQPGQDDGERQPDIMVISCADSPTAPESIFGTAPGEMYVVSNVANFVPEWMAEGGHASDDTNAAIEFGIEVLKVKHIIVLGHTNCSCIHAFANKASSVTQHDLVGTWISQLTPIADHLGSRDNDHEAWIQRLERAVVEHSLMNLMTFPRVREGVKASSLTLHGAHFDAATGTLFERNPASGEFEPYSKL
jgi:carbonic anhydrase